MSGPLMRRRTLGGLAAGALAAGTMTRTASAADTTTFVSGTQLPANLDPHQVFDVPMQALMLNGYDNLYRYQNDPPEIVPGGNQVPPQMPAGETGQDVDGAVDNEDPGEEEVPQPTLRQ